MSNFSTNKERTGREDPGSRSSTDIPNTLRTTTGTNSSTKSSDKSTRASTTKSTFYTSSVTTLSSTYSTAGHRNTTRTTPSLKVSSSHPTSHTHGVGEVRSGVTNPLPKTLQIMENPQDQRALHVSSAGVGHRIKEPIATNAGAGGGSKASASIISSLETHGGSGNRQALLSSFDLTEKKYDSALSGKTSALSGSTTQEMLVKYHPKPPHEERTSSGVKRFYNTRSRAEETGSMSAATKGGEAPAHSSPAVTTSSTHHPSTQAPPPSTTQRSFQLLPTKSNIHPSLPQLTKPLEGIGQSSVVYVTASNSSRPLDSPVYSSGNTSSGDLEGAYSSEGEHQQASSMGKHAKMVPGLTFGGNNDKTSFNFDGEKGKVIFKTSAHANAVPPSSSASDEGPCPDASSMERNAASNKEETDLLPEGLIASTEDHASGYSRQRSNLTESYNSQSSTESGDKVLTPHRSIPFDKDYKKRIHRSSSSKSHSSEEGSEDVTTKRPMERQTSSGKQKHACVGVGNITPVDSVGKPVASGNDESARSGTLQVMLESDAAMEIARKDEKIGALMKVIEEKDKVIVMYWEERRRKAEGGVGNDLNKQLEEYTHQRQQTAELARLHSVEEHEKLVQEELQACKKERNQYERQMIRLTEELSLKEEQFKSLKHTYGELCSENERLSKLKSEEDFDITTLKKELQKKDKLLKKMKEHVKEMSANAAIDAEEPLFLPASAMGTHEGEEVGGGVEVEGLQQQQRPATSQLPITTATGSRRGFGEEHEKELARLYEEMKLKDKTIEAQNRQLQKLESTGENLAALVQRNTTTAQVIKTLKKKADGLEEENEQLKANIEELTKANIAFSSSESELEDARKQVDLLEEQLDEQQKHSDKLERHLKVNFDQSKKAAERINHLEQKNVALQAVVSNTQQELQDAQERATKIATHSEQQKEEIHKLKKQVTDLQGEIQAQKFTSDTFREDFEAERKDREKAHSKMAEMEMQYTNQFQKLGQELEAVSKRANHAERKLKEKESQFQAQLSQSSYITGEKKKLEDEVLSKTQQVKQYKKQADHYKDELATFKVAHDAQKQQIEQMAMELERSAKIVKSLEHENGNLKAKERHQLATGGRAVGRVSPSASEKIEELERQVDALQMEKVILQSQVEQIQPRSQAPPIHSQAPPTHAQALPTHSSSSSRDRLGHNISASALPNRYPPLGNQAKAHSVDDPSVHLSGSQGRQGRIFQGDRNQSSNMQYRDHSQFSHSLRGSEGSPRAHTSFHHPQDSHNMGSSRSTQPPLDQLNRHSTNASASGDSYNFPSNADPAFAQSSTSNAPRHNLNPSSNPAHQYNVNVSNGSTHPYNVPPVYVQGNISPFSTGSTSQSSQRPSNFIPRNHNGSYLQTNSNEYPTRFGNPSSPSALTGYTPSGPASLPGNILSPKHQEDPQRGRPGGGLYRAHDDNMAMGGGSDTVEKDSPPTSFMSPPGPSSLNLQSVQGLLPPHPPRHHSHQLAPRQGQVGGAGGQTGSGRGLLGQNQRTYGGNVISQSTTPTSSAINPVKHSKGSETSLTSLGPGAGNQLEVGIDSEIGAAADDIKNLVGGNQSVGGASEDAPYDPNLVCPTCGKKFRIGQIQNFRHHAASCTRKK